MAEPTSELEFISEIELKLETKMKNNENLKNLSSISFRLRHWFSDYQDIHCSGTTISARTVFPIVLSINKLAYRYVLLYGLNVMFLSGPYNKEYLSAP